MDYEIDFLAVGDASRSGDSIAVRFGNLSGARDEQVVVVIDGGYRDSGEALVKHIATHYGTDRIDVVVSTHPDCDHVNGLYVVLEQTKVDTLLMHQPWLNTIGISDLFKSSQVADHTVREHLQKSLDSARTLESLAKRKGIKIIQPFVGVAGWNNAFRIVGPNQDYYTELLADFRGTPEAAEESLLQKALDALLRLAEEKFDFETLANGDDTSAENNSSAVCLFTFDGQHFLMTGDAGKGALDRVATQLDSIGIDRSDLRFVQIPHHGSRHNVGPKVLDHLLGPKLQTDAPTRVAYVSAAKEGEPKHPSKRVMNAFRRRGYAVHATQGRPKRYSSSGTPARVGWSPCESLPFFAKVEPIDD